MDSKHLIALAALALAGCSVAPDSVSLEQMHVSHPLLGPPFGPSIEEDTLDVLGVRTRWTRGPYYVEAGLGQQMKDSGFYGDGIIFTSRVGVTLWSKQ
jgi:hypothetical protein